MKVACDASIVHTLCTRILVYLLRCIVYIVHTLCTTILVYLLRCIVYADNRFGCTWLQLYKSTLHHYNHILSAGCIGGSELSDTGRSTGSRQGGREKELRRTSSLLTAINSKLQCLGVLPLAHQHNSAVLPGYISVELL